MQQESANMASLRNWLRSCPALSSDSRFRVDYLAENPTEYALYAVPSALKTRENIIGRAVLQDVQEQNFIFASKESYGSDIQQNLYNLGFYDAVVAWIMEQNNKQNYPMWTVDIEGWENAVVKSVVPTLSAYVAQAGANSAKYQIQIKVTYGR